MMMVISSMLAYPPSQYPSNAQVNDNNNMAAYAYYAGPLPKEATSSMSDYNHNNDNSENDVDENDVDVAMFHPEIFSLDFH